MSRPFTVIRNNRKITEDDIREMHRMSMNGVGDKAIARRFWVYPNKINECLSRVMPDGRITSDRFGGAKHPDQYDKYEAQDKRILYI